MLKDFTGSPVNKLQVDLGRILMSGAIKLYVNSLIAASGDGYSPKSPKKTIQEAVNLANTVANKGKSFDIIVANGYYFEKVTISDAQNAIWSDTVSLLQCIANAGRLRIIADGDVLVSNGSAATAPTFKILRPAVELIGLNVYSKTATKPAILVKCEKNTGWGGTDDAGFAAGFKMSGCHLKDVGVGDAPNAGSSGLRLESALYPEIENCIFEGFTDGVHQTGSGTGYSIRPVYRGCRFEGNTNDIASGGTQFARVENCAFPDANSTKHLVTIGGGVPDDSDCMIIGGFVNAANFAKLIPDAGWTAAGVALATASTMAGESDLSS